MAREIAIRVTGDTKDLERALSRASKTTQTSFQKISRAAKVASIALGTGLAVGAFKAVKAASALEEAQNAATEVFGKSSKQVLEWSKNTQDAFSQVDFLGAAKSFATFARAADLSDKETAGFSKRLLLAAQDLSSFHDAVPTEVLDDLRSGLAGETEPLRKYGILVNEAALQQEAMRLGLVKGKEALTEREKVLARQSLILGQLGAAQGDWNRTLSSAANQERIAAATTADLSAQLGQSLLPAYKALLTIGIQVTGWMQKNQGVVKGLVVGLVALTAALGAVAVATKVYTAVTRVATAATVLFGIAQRNLPLVRVALLILAIGTALVVAYKKSETFRAIVARVIEFIRAHWQKLLFAFGLLPGIIGQIIRHWGTLREAGVRAFGFLAAAARSVASAISTVVSWVSSAINAIGRLANAIRSLPRLPDVIPDVIPGAGRLQHGGPAMAGRPYIVGERGPELFVPRSSGRVIPNNRLRSNGGGGWGRPLQVNLVVGSRQLGSVIVDLDKEYRQQNGGKGLLG